MDTLVFSEKGGDYGFGYIGGIPIVDTLHLRQAMECRPRLVPGPNDGVNDPPTVDSGDVEFVAQVVAKQGTGVMVGTVHLWCPGSNQIDNNGATKTYAKLDANILDHGEIEIGGGQYENEWSETKAFWVGGTP